MNRGIERRACTVLVSWVSQVSKACWINGKEKTRKWVLVKFISSNLSFTWWIITPGTGFKEDKRNLMGLWDQASHSGRCWGWNVTFWSLIEHNNSIIEKGHKFNEQEHVFLFNFQSQIGTHCEGWPMVGDTIEVRWLFFESLHFCPPFQNLSLRLHF